MSESYIPVKGIDNYKVSRFGNILKLDDLKKDKTPRTISKRTMNNFDSNGNLLVSLRINKDINKTTIKLSKLIYSAYNNLNPLDNSWDIGYKDNNTKNIDIENLKYIKSLKLPKYSNFSLEDLDGEIWAKAKHNGQVFKDYYVSNKGRVKSKKCSRSKILSQNCVCGYYSVFIENNIYVHDLVYESFYGSLNGLVVDHIDTNRTNNSLENLRKVTQKENMNNPETLKKLQKRCILLSYREDEIISVFQSVKEARKKLGYNYYGDNYYPSGKLVEYNFLYYKIIDMIYSDNIEIKKSGENLMNQLSNY